MNTRKGFTVAALAASIALAIGSTAVMAAAPAANQLPGQGAVATGSINTATTGVLPDGKTLNVVLTADSVIKWGTGTDINKTGTAGFNIGADATVAFSGAFGVLNIDTTGNPSQIFGKLTSAATPAASGLFVANENGIIVGTNATIQATGTGDVGLIGNTLGSGAFSNTASVTYNGTSTGSGDVTVQPGATIKGANVIVAGAGTVNVDLGGVAGNALLTAGLSTGGAFSAKNPSTNLAVTGGMGVVTKFDSAGTATTNGILNLAGVTTNVAGLLTNNGDLTLGAINNAVYSKGQLRSTGPVTFTSLANDGAYAAAGVDAVSVEGGDLVNNGMMTTDGTVTVTNGSIVNNGAISGARKFEVTSDSTLASFTKGADYSITNAGTITSPNLLLFDANDQDNQSTSAGPGNLNGSIGSFTNTGKLQVAPGNGLYLYANNDVTLGGLVQTNDGTTVKAISPTNPLGDLDLQAASLQHSGAFTSDGVLTVSTPLAVDSGVYLAGNQVKLMDNLSAVDATGAPAHDLYIVAGAAQAADYAVRVASGKTISADTVYVLGDVAEHNPNVILQGTISGNDVEFGWPGLFSISDLFSGPAGGLSMFNSGGVDPYLYLNFTGGVKTAKYNNSSNFRFNGLPVNVTDGSPLYVELNPVAYTTNGTSNGLSAVNLLVNSDVNLTSALTATVLANGTAVTGVTNIPNTHLVLQSSGDITTTGNFYWPGYVYLGNVTADADGNALPGTLGDGTITTLGEFNNVLPGDVAGASGIHFITGKPLVLGGDVVTNANAWVNFGTDLLTQNYASGMLGSGKFFGGVKGSGSVVNYGDLDPSMFNTHAPDATK